SRAGVPIPSAVKADFDCDGVADTIEAGGPGEAPIVKITNGKTNKVMLNFFAYSPNFTGGINFGLGNFNGDCAPDIVTGPGAGGGPNVKVFDGRTGTLLKSFFAYNASFTGGVRVAVGDVNGDGYPDIVTGTGPGGG